MKAKKVLIIGGGEVTVSLRAPGDAVGIDCRTKVRTSGKGWNDGDDE